MAQEQLYEKYESILKDLPEKTKEFLIFHGIQLMNMGFPANASLIEQLHMKLEKEIFDQNNYLSLMDNQHQERYELYSKVMMKKNEHVFLLDHQLSFKIPELRQHLYQNQALMDRLQNMLKYGLEKKDAANYESENQGLGNLEVTMDNMEIENPLKYIIHKDTHCVSFYGNKIREIEYVEQLLEENSQLRMLWLNDNPLDQVRLRSIIEEKFTQIELLNSRFTSHVRHFTVKMTSLQMDAQRYSSTSDEQMVYLDFEQRGLFELSSEKIKEIVSMFPSVIKMNLKENPTDRETFKETVQVLLEACDQLVELELDHDQQIWMYEMVQQKQVNSESLKKVNGFYLDQPIPSQKDFEVRDIISKIWRVAQNYRLQSEGTLDFSMIWYVLDEYGCALVHNEEPNFQVFPILFNKGNDSNVPSVAFSIAWNTQLIPPKDILSRDYLKGISEQFFRSARYYPWFNIPEQYFIDKYNVNRLQLGDNKVQHMSQFDILREISSDKEEKKEVLKVYLDDEGIRSALRSELFQVVDSMEEADVVHLIFKAIDQEMENELRGKMVNQFPYETCITMKNNLAKTIQRVLGECEMIQTTYDLTDQLDAFMGDYFLRQKEQRDNIWIIKHPNLARSLDMTVTSDLTLIQKLTLNTPRIAQKYIHNPVCMNGKKVDLRFILVVRSVSPVDICLFKHFWIRSANKDYALDERSLSSYDTHFTVMNYGAGEDMKTIYWQQFVENFEATHNVSWESIYEQIKEDLRQVVGSAAIGHPDMQNENARAIYGIDYMVDEDTLKPKLLEVTYSPDCLRANTFYPSFWDDIFECMYHNKINPLIERL